MLLLQTPTTPAQWLTTAQQFKDRWNMANTLGSLDGKHIVIQKPPNTGSQFINYKHTFSVVLLALVDADYKFLYVDIGCNGRVSDGGVFSRSTLSQALESNSIGFPEPDFLPGTDRLCPYYIVADEAFPLRTYLMKPFPHRKLHHDQRIFNYRLSRARRIVENAFGILANRFRVFMTRIMLTPDSVDKIVLAACTLHNYLRSHRSAVTLYSPHTLVDSEDSVTHSVTPGSWRTAVGQQPTRVISDRDTNINPWSQIGRQQGSMNRPPFDAKVVRNLLCEYVNSDAGKVYWQEDMIK